MELIGTIWKYNSSSLFIICSIEFVIIILEEAISGNSSVSLFIVFIYVISTLLLKNEIIPSLTIALLE